MRATDTPVKGVVTRPLSRILNKLGRIALERFLVLKAMQDAEDLSIYLKAEVR